MPDFEERLNNLEKALHELMLGLVDLAGAVDIHNQALMEGKEILKRTLEVQLSLSNQMTEIMEELERNDIYVFDIQKLPKRRES